MRRIVRLVTTAAVVAIASPALAAEEATVTELISQSAEFDGSEVVVEGELIGDYGFRNDGWMWTQLNGDIYAQAPLRESERPAGGNVGIGIRIPTDLATGLDPPGRYRVRGPLVSVTGVWQHHAVDRQGESFLEVETLEVLEPGRALSQGANWWTIAAGLALIGGAYVIHLTRTQD